MKYKSEQWADIAVLHNKYQVSNLGNVRNTRTQRLLTPFVDNNGYLVYQFYDGKHKTIRAHRLVAMCFIDNPNNYDVINHIDMDKSNNCVDNLEWCTQKHNVNEMLKQKPEAVYGIINYNKHIKPRRILQLDRQGKRIAEFESASEASRKTGVCVRNILQVASKSPLNNAGKIRKTAGGFVWAFTEGVI